MTQSGDRYVFGAEQKDMSGRVWDCSELVEVVCRSAGVRPTVPDGAYYQWKHCQSISVSRAAGIPGALLFFGDGTGVGRNAITHVAFSRGNGTTIEARSTRYGVGSFPIAGRPFRWAGLIPGVDYSNAAPVVPDEPTQNVPPASGVPTEPEDDVYLRDQKSGAIYAVSATHWDHLTGPQWADRVKEGAEAVDVPPEIAFHFLKSRHRIR
jgi:cell wall-associated NlpC family hydrolase